MKVAKLHCEVCGKGKTAEVLREKGPHITVCEECAKTYAGQQYLHTFYKSIGAVSQDSFIRQGYPRLGQRK